ncbi:MAG: TlpA disulfide reductase family protein [Candidatus Thorarchaeota archaeon]|nr:TlpA disulfide reductase family protein [Candidatus Thorarchaeota archaeon]
METEKMVIGGVLVAIIAVGLLIGVLLVMTPSSIGDTNSGESSSIPALTADSDFGQTRKAPDWGLLMSTGDVVQLSSLEGKFIVVDLMSLNCPSCETQNDELDTLIDAMGDSIEVVSLSVDVSTSVSQMEQYKINNEIGWSHGLDTNSVFTYYFNIRYTPTIVIIDADGYFRMYHEGVWTSTDIQSTISLMDRA